jgi:prophage regulatory protein
MSKNYSSQEKQSAFTVSEQKRREPENVRLDQRDGGGRILRRPEVQRRTGLSRSTIYGLMAEGLFPRPVRLGKRAVGWPDHVIAEFIQSRSQTGEG